MSHPALSPVQVGSLELSNRTVVAPMSRVSTRGDGLATPQMVAYYARFARGGFGLVVTEGTYTDQWHSQAYPNQPAITTAAHVAAWRTVTDAVHAAGGRIVLQLMHAGALVQQQDGGSVPIAPSAVAPRGAKMPAYGGGHGPFALPQAATLVQIRQAVEGFAASAARAVEAGFDGVEIHGANGYLIDQFLTTYTNVRDDEYGGATEDRVRFAVEVVRAVREATTPDFVVGIRLSQTKVNDLDYRWPGGATEAETIFRAVAKAGVDYLHLASEGRDWLDTATLDTGVTNTRLAREITGLPVIANGGMHTEAQACSVLAEGHADLVALGRGALSNPDWPVRLATGAEFVPFDHAMLRPDVTLTTQARWERSHGLPGLPRLPGLPD